MIGVLDGTRQDNLNAESEKYDDNYDGLSKSKYQCSIEAIPTTTPAPVIRTDIVLTETGSSNSFAVAAITAAAAAAVATAADLYANDLAITNPGVVSNEDGNSILIADDDDNSNAKLKLDGENLIRILNGIQQEYLTEYETSSHGNNYYDNKYDVFCDRRDDDNSPTLPPESFDDDV